MSGSVCLSQFSDALCDHFQKNIFKNFENNSLSNPNCVTFWKKIKGFLEYTNFISNSLHHLTTVGISVKCPLCIQISWVPIIIFKFNFILWFIVSQIFLIYLLWKKMLCLENLFQNLGDFLTFMLNKRSIKKCVVGFFFFVKNLPWLAWVQIFWEGPPNLAHLPIIIWRYQVIPNKRVEDEPHFCGILRISELQIVLQKWGSIKVEKF